jgi:hypothetical protein
MVINIIMASSGASAGSKVNADAGLKVTADAGIYVTDYSLYSGHNSSGIIYI